MKKSILNGMASASRRVVAVLAFTLAFFGCQFEPYNIYTSKATLSTTVLNYEAATISGTTRGDGDYSWEIFVEKGKEFCSAQSSRGTVGKDFYLKLKANEGEDLRIAKVLIKFNDGYSTTFEITQFAKTSHAEYDRAWAEQPILKEEGNLIHKTYYTTLNGKRVRNYSICYDYSTLVPQWVAYPVHDCYMSGEVSRTDKWAFDDTYYTPNSNDGYTKKRIVTHPEIPKLQQQNIEKSSYGVSGLDRGHMLPSASRTSSYELNAQTFYATNMMPQHSQFNRGRWGSLEKTVQGLRVNDTLYVVVGTIYEGAMKTIYSNERTIGVPTHCYKLLLSTKDGKSGKHIATIKSADELRCIGFLFSNDSNGAATSIADAAVPVSQIEKLTGHSFFRNLDPSIADKVKAQKDLGAWGLK